MTVIDEAVITDAPGLRGCKLKSQLDPPRYFESIENNCAIGWACDASGRPTGVAAHVNGIFAATNRVRRFPFWMPKAQLRRYCRFEIPLRLRPGDKVEVFDAGTGAPLPGGVRIANDRTRRLQVGIISPVRQEELYLLEWIAYHRSLGIETFLLGDNGGSDRTSELLRALDEAGIVQRTDWLGAKTFQLQFDMDSVARLRGVVDVVSITDTDEFLRPLNGRSDILSAVNEIFASSDVSAVGLNLVVYGSSGRVEPGEGLVIERFTSRGPEGHVRNRAFKTMVRPERCEAMINPHVVDIATGLYVNDRGDPVEWGTAPGTTKSPSWNCLRIDHFVIKSRHEFSVKAARGQFGFPNSVVDRSEAFFLSRDRNEVSDPIPDVFVERTKEELCIIRDQLERFGTSWAQLRDFPTNK